jgi:hypothetical protein
VASPLSDLREMGAAFFPHEREEISPPSEERGRSLASLPARDADDRFSSSSRVGVSRAVPNA